MNDQEAREDRLPDESPMWLAARVVYLEDLVEDLRRENGQMGETVVALNRHIDWLTRGED